MEYALDRIRFFRATGGTPTGTLEIAYLRITELPDIPEGVGKFRDTQICYL